LLDAAPIRASADDLILVWRLLGGDRMLDRMPIATSVTSRQSCLAPAAYPCYTIQLGVSAL